MRPDEVLAQVVKEIETATADVADVRLAGGDQDVSPPEIIVQWNADRLQNANGHTPYAGAKTDDNGFNTAREFHSYYEATLTCTIRYYDEIEKDKAQHDLQSHFVRYEDDASLFHEDTRMWDVGDTFPSDNPMVNPDWYETDYIIGFQFVARSVSDDLDAIESITDNISII